MMRVAVPLESPLPCRHRSVFSTATSYNSLHDCTAASYSSLQSDMHPAQIKAEEAANKIKGNVNLSSDYKAAYLIESAFYAFAFCAQ
jgi:hypothetical protein